MEGTHPLCDNQGKARSSRRSHHGRFVVSNEAWERQRPNIYQLYIEQDETLSQTMQKMKDKYDFKAGKRKYKMKLKQWGMEKYSSAADMGTLIAKAAKRRVVDGKETVFYNRGQEISAEKLENFKKRMTSNDTVITYHDAKTPTNITYNTPHPELDPAIVDMKSNDSAIHLDLFDFSDQAESAPTEDQLGTGEEDEINLDVSSFAEDDDLESVAEQGNEVSMDETSVLPCGHRKQKNMAEAFEESLSAPISDEFIAALKILYGLQDSDDSRIHLPEDGESYSQAEVQILGRRKILSSKRLRAVFDLSTILESQKDSRSILNSRALEGEKLRSVEDRLSCQGCIEDYITSFRSVLAMYEQLNQWQDAFLVMSVLRSLYLELQWWENLKSTLTEMHKLLEDFVGKKLYISSDILVGCLEMASTYSFLNDFISAHSVFSCVLPKLWLLDEIKYEPDIIYGYVVLGLHYEYQGLWREAFEYLSLAHKGLMKTAGHFEASFLKQCLDKVSELMRVTTESRTDSEQRKVLDQIEMNRTNTLLRNISHGKLWEAVMEDKNENEDSEMDVRSNKYGLTYSVTSVTGISDSKFMEP